jgi:hypothetical protein
MKGEKHEKKVSIILKNQVNRRNRKILKEMISFQNH